MTRILVVEDDAFSREAVLYLEKLYKERIDPKCLVALRSIFFAH